MKIRNFVSAMLIAMICLSLVTGMAIAQQPIPSSLEDGVVQDPGSEPPITVRPSQDPTPRTTFDPPQDRDPTQDQPVLINAKYAGWGEVTESPNGDRISDTLRGNWIMVDANGRFDGRVVASRDADVTQMNIFLMNKGRLVKQTALNTEGRFEFNNVRQGAYALIGWGNNGFFAFGMNIVAFNPQNNGKVVNTVNATAYQNKTTINTDWINYYASQVNFRVYGRYPTGEGRDDPPELFGFKGVYENVPTSRLATSISSHAVAKTADGRVVGRVHQTNSISGRPVDVRSTKVMLFQGDNVVASTTTDNYGAFAFPQVPDGEYGLTAVGVDGVGMIAINVTGGAVANNAGEVAPSLATPVDFTMISSETIGWLNSYASEVAYRRVLMTPRPSKPVEGIDDCPYCGNPGCNTCQSWAFCKSRGISFEQWAQSGCQAQAQKYGDGSILAAWTKQQRKYVEKSKARYDKAFYPEQDFNGLNLNQNYPNQGYPYQGIPNQPFGN